MSDFVIENGVLKKYTGPGWDVVIPEGVTEIGDYAFARCESLVNVTILGNVTSIDGWAFFNCTCLKSVLLPESLSSIGSHAFSNCRSLQSVRIPAGVTEIGDRAFYFCESLTSVCFESKYPKLEADVFVGCKKLRVPPDELRTDVPLPAQLAMHFLPVTDDVRAYIILFQTAKAWRERAERVVTTANTDGIVNDMNGLIRAQKKLPAKAGTQAVEFALAHLGNVRAETLRALAAALEEKKCKKALEKLHSDPAAGRLLGVQMEDEDPIDELVRENWVVNDTVKALQRVIKSGIPYAGLEKVSTPQAVIYVIAAYEDARDRLESYYRQPVLVPAADQVAGALDRKALLDLLEQQVYENSNGRCLAALARYGGEEQAERLVAGMRAWKWYWQRVILFSDTKAAVIYAEKQGWMDIYAKLRGTDAETIWIKVMMDFSLDKEGKKVYDLGGRTVTAALGEDMKFSLFDETAGKTVRTLPKKDADPDKLAAAGKDLTEMRKNIKKVVKTQGDALLRRFLSGESQSADRWRELYIEDPVLRHLARLTVWNQGKDTFTLGTDGVIRSDGTAYMLTGAPIGVAHPMEIQPADIAAWQNYFVANGLKQLFEQVWEPAVDPKTIRPDRYMGCVVSDKVFMYKKKHGIYFSPGFGNGTFFNEAELRLEGCELGWSYHKTENDQIVLGAFSFKKYTRQVNHIVALLDRWTVAGRILKDDVSVRENLDQFTAAQIMEYIRLASENACPNCAAMLLEYKQAHYPNFDPLAEFTLE